MAKKMTVLFSFFFAFILIVGSSSANADSWYAGVTKPGSTYLGMYAYITTPTSLPSLGDSGESAWVSNVTSTRDWIQTGIRYYSGYSGFRTYIEHTYNGVHGMEEVGTHLLDTSIQYTVQYEGADSKWHGYIAGYDKGSWNLGTYNNVQANAESHATNTQMGPFRFTSVSYKNSSGVWTVNDTAPTAKSPYSVSKTSNANFRVYGP
ncbi:hypothetical protein [Paenibacillus xylanivorans]|uniref:Uncharacterized protein n=1 Tax=Paenibacillus xylanivorans TaxID=1705561 RepID=A0A0M9BK38_9BACL|nr:hypothetical protein [Paenibacillus xylanivorans]KOY13066.1 hypothetical protein AMS66_29025 [Paenibacillus xylanivorans]